MLAIRRDDPEGQCVAAADRMHDYLQLLFWTADVLKVFNEYEAQGVHGASPITDLVGLFADAVAVQDNAIELAFGAPGLRIHLNLDSSVSHSARRPEPAWIRAARPVFDPR